MFVDPLRIGLFKIPRDVLCDSRAAVCLVFGLYFLIYARVRGDLSLRMTIST